MTSPRVVQLPLNHSHTAAHLCATLYTVVAKHVYIRATWKSQDVRLQSRHILKPHKTIQHWLQSFVVGWQSLDGKCDAKTRKKFHEVQWRHISCVVGTSVRALSQVYCRFLWLNNFENQPAFCEVIRSRIYSVNFYHSHLGQRAGVFCDTLCRLHLSVTPKQHIRTCVSIMCPH